MMARAGARAPAGRRGFVVLVAIVDGCGTVMRGARPGRGDGLLARVDIKPVVREDEDEGETVEHG